MIGICNRCGRSHELDTTAFMCGTFTTVYGGPVMTFSPPCENCKRLESALAAARAVLDGGMVGDDSPQYTDIELRVDRAAWLAWQGRKETP